MVKVRDKAPTDFLSTLCLDRSTQNTAVGHSWPELCRRQSVNLQLLWIIHGIWVNLSDLQGIICMVSRRKSLVSSSGQDNEWKGLHSHAACAWRDPSQTMPCPLGDCKAEVTKGLAPLSHWFDAAAMTNVGGKISPEVRCHVRGTAFPLVEKSEYESFETFRGGQQGCGP